MRVILATSPVLVIASHREPEGAPVDGIAWRHNARGIARMARSYGSSVVCLGRRADPSRRVCRGSAVLDAIECDTPKRSRSLVKVQRIVANIENADIAEADAFYRDVLGLEVVMDHGWIRTYGSGAKMSVQVSFATEGGSGTPVPHLSIEVDDLSEALRRVEEAGIPVEYGPKSEPWGVRRFYVRDPFGKLVNILQHE